MEEVSGSKGTANMTGSPIVLDVIKEHARDQLMSILDAVCRIIFLFVKMEFFFYFFFHFLR